MEGDSSLGPPTGAAIESVVALCVDGDGDGGGGQKEKQPDLAQLDSKRPSSSFLLKSSESTKDRPSQPSSRTEGPELLLSKLHSATLGHSRRAFISSLFGM